MIFSVFYFFRDEASFYFLLLASYFYLISPFPVISFGCSMPKI